MVRSTTSVKLMSLLLVGEPVSDRQLAQSIGFHDPRNIAKHLKSFQNMNYIRELPRNEYGPGNWYQLTRQKEGLIRLYQSNFYKNLRIQIRGISWFIREMAEGFRTLPPDLYSLVIEMMEKSHSFFTIVTTHASHETVLSAYALYLFPCRLMKKEDPGFQSWYLYTQLYAESVTRDIKQGGLAGGFMEPFDRIQKILTGMVPGSAMTLIPIVECQRPDHLHNP